MKNFITNTNLTADIDQMNADLNSILTYFHWSLPTSPVHNQIGIRHRVGAENIWLDSAGSLYNKDLGKFTGREIDFSEWNPYLPQYTRKIIEKLMAHENIKIGRARYIRCPIKTGLTIHRDFEERYHFVLRTNANALFGEKVDEESVVAKCYHIPADGFFYKVDTLREHFIYNGGSEDRIHLVLNVVS